MSSKIETFVTWIISCVIGVFLGHFLWYGAWFAIDQDQTKQSVVINIQPDVFDLEATAYSIERFTNQTAILEDAKPGWTVATSRDNLFLLGKKVFILGIGVREVTDLMAEGITNTVDICVGTEEEATQFGRQNIRLVILRGN